MKYFFYISYLSIILSCNAEKKTIFVNGSLIDKDTKEGIAYAKLVFSTEDSVFEIISDKNGNFSVNLNEDKYKIKILVVGYPNFVNMVSITDSITLRFELPSVPLETPLVKFDEGWVTIIDDNGKIKCYHVEKIHNKK